MANDTSTLKEAAPEGPSTERTRAGLVFRPLVDIVEQAEELTIHADVPGASGEDVDLRFEDGLLTIHVKVPPRHEETQFLLQEYGVGDFYRTFEISEAIDPSKITAECGDGVLVLHLPKAEAIRPRRIEVKPR